MKELFAGGNRGGRRDCDEWKKTVEADRGGKPGVSSRKREKESQLGKGYQ